MFADVGSHWVNRAVLIFIFATSDECLEVRTAPSTPHCVSGGSRLDDAVGYAMKCIFGCRNAVAVYILPKGCVCKREIVQPLCAQHEHKCTPLGRMILVKRFWSECG